MKPLYAALLTIPCVLSGCLTSSRVQMDYIDMRDECRQMAEENADFYKPQPAASQALQTKNVQAVLAQIFHDCMELKGWTVASPGIKRKAPPRYAPPVPRAAPQPQQPLRYIPAEPPRPARQQSQRKPVNVAR